MMNDMTPSYEPAPQAEHPFSADAMKPAAQTPDEGNRRQFSPESSFSDACGSDAAPRPMPQYSAPQANEPRPNPQKKKKHAPMTAGKVLLVALCFALIGSILGGGMVCFWAQKNPEVFSDDSGAVVKAAQEITQPSAQPVTQQQATPVTNNGKLLTPAQIYQMTVPGIVGITNEATGYGGTSASTGTGFVISADGEIITNYHVISGAQTLTVTLYDGTKYSATVLGYEESSDVALIKIDAQNLTALTLGDSDALIVGDEIAAIGNPLGELTYTMTVGYVSAKERDVNTDGTPINMMQIDAAINPGNSGGPLFNMKGEVVGITTAKYSGSTGGGATIEGIGFAIPINDATAILDDLRENGTVTNRAYMGITGSSVSADDAEAYDVPLGVRVSSVTESSSADKAGLQKNDIITAVGGKTVAAYEDLYRILRSYRGGDTASITVYRSGETLELSITFDAAQIQSAEQTQPVEPEPTEEIDPWEFWNFLP